jgi:hypothetical protein
MTPSPTLEYGLLDALGSEHWIAHRSLFGDFVMFLGEQSEFEAVDLDGDHVPELTFVHSPDNPEGVTIRNRHFLTYKDGKIRSYDFPGDAWEDVDHDGRMDAVSSGLEWVHTARWEEIDLRRVRRLLHQRADGTFVSDELSREFLRHDCPAPPSDVMVRDAKGFVDEAVSAIHLECARLWGMSSDALVTRVRESCRAEPDPSGEAERGRDTCLFRWALEDIVRETEPAL